MNAKIPQTQEALYQFNCALDGFDKMVAARSVVEVRKGWEDVLFSFNRCIARLISEGIDNPASREWGYRLKHQSTEGDPGLVYLRECRAKAEHVKTNVHQFSKPGVMLFGGILVEGNSSGYFGLSQPDGTIKDQVFLNLTNDGADISARGPGTRKMVRKNAEVELGNVFWKKGKKELPPPKAIGGIKVADDSAISLAVAAIDFSKDMITELSELLAVTK